MQNFILFSNTFLSYLMVFFIFMACIVVAVFAGIKARKFKDKKDAMKKETLEDKE